MKIASFNLSPAELANLTEKTLSIPQQLRDRICNVWITFLNTTDTPIDFSLFINALDNHVMAIVSFTAPNGEAGVYQALSPDSASIDLPMFAELDLVINENGTSPTSGRFKIDVDVFPVGPRD